jgi:hypothetical protein
MHFCQLEFSFFFKKITLRKIDKCPMKVPKNQQLRLKLINKKFVKKTNLKIRRKIY